MTTHHVLLAQNKIGFSDEARSNRFRQLEEGERESICQAIHVPGYEKTYWSATVVESLQHEAGVCEQIENEDSLRIAVGKNVTASTSDNTFLRHSRMAAGGKNGKLPPAAFVEVYQDLEAEVAKLRRLYLIIVDLQHPIRSVESTNHDKESCVLIHSISPKFNRGWTGSKEAFQKIGKNLHPCCPLLGSVPQ